MAAGAVAVPQIVPLTYVSGLSVNRRNIVDSSTKFDISSDTIGALIYFTIDGSRPGESSRSTRKYRHPFSLQPGKYTIRAVAVTPDGRESAVASRTFTVTGLKGTVLEGRNFHLSESPRTDGVNFVDDISARSARRSGRPSSSKAMFSRHLHDAWTEEKRAARPQNFESIRLSGDLTSVPIEQSHIDERNMQRTMFQPNQMGDDTTQLYTCARCGLRLPSGVSRCVVCECDSILVTSLPPNGTVSQQAPVQNVPTSTTQWAASTCLVCGIKNPPEVQRCLSCQAVLPNDKTPGFIGTSAPTMPVVQPPVSVPVQGTSTHARCGNCSRLNDIRARFCDWCSSRLTGVTVQQSQQALCSKCGSPLIAPNRPCFTCGTISIPPSRGDAGAVNAAPAYGNKYMSQTTPVIERDHLRSVTNDDIVLKVSKTTQTIQSGSFVPPTNPNEPMSYQTSSLSPGRGYWRQQLKHINGQLEAFASRSPDFRASVGPHQLGRLLAARVTNSGGDEFVLRLVFNLPNQHNQRSYMASRDSARRPMYEYDRSSAIGGSIDGYSRYIPNRGRRAYGDSQYADYDDYISSDHQINRRVDRLAIDDRSREDTELVTASSDEETADHDILDTFRGDRYPVGSRMLYGTKRRTNQNFVVSSTPRRAGRKVAGAAVSKSLGGPSSRKRPPSAVEQAISSKPSMLVLKELGVDGAGRIHELARHFSENDVDPATKSRDGWSLAHLAVINRHPDAIAVLAQYAKQGEDVVSARGPSTALGNTPLHEAVRLSTTSAAALEALDALLKCGADVQKPNDRGETPFEYAQRLGHSEAGKKIAASMGQRRLQAAGLASENRNAGLSD